MLFINMAFYTAYPFSNLYTANKIEFCYGNRGTFSFCRVYFGIKRTMYQHMLAMLQEVYPSLFLERAVMTKSIKGR